MNLALSHAPRTAPRRQVLLVEDDPSQARLLARWLERDGGFEVTHAPDGNSAERLAREGDFDLLVTDIQLPDIDGIEVLRRSKARNPWLPALLITAHASMEYAVAAMQSGADDFLVKPVGREALVQRAARVIEESERTGQRPRTVLAVEAWPGDALAGCGGVLLAHLDRGDRVRVLTLCADPDVPAPDVLIDAIHGPLVRGDVGDGPRTIGLLEHAIRASGADVLYLPSAHDTQLDRVHTQRAGLVAGRGVAEVFCYQTLDSTVAFQPNKFVDVANTLEWKIRLLAETPELPAQADPQTARATCAYWGRFAGFGLVEALEVIRARG